MRLLVAAPEYPPRAGGMERHAAEICRLLSLRGWEVRVLATPPDGRAPLAAARVLGRSFAASRRRLRREARRFRPDAILVMNAGFAPAALLPGPHPPPVVVRTAGNDAYAPWYGPRLPLRFLLWRLPARRPGSIGARLRRIDQERRTAAILRALAECATVLCNSGYVRDRLRDLGVPGDRLRVVVGGVDVTEFSPAPGASRRGPGPIVLGAAGHLKPIKGFDVALRMLARLAGPGAGAVLRLAGAGEEEGRLRALARGLGVEGRVAFLGESPPEAMPAFFRGLDLYLQPSVEIESSGVRQAESMGRALCEALACGVPVVASRSGGIPDVVEEGVTGALVPPGDADALAGAVEACLADPARRAAMARAARARAVARFSWEAIAELTRRCIEDAVSRSLTPAARRAGAPAAPRPDGALPTR